MKITLYKNCIFSRSYSEVCDCVHMFSNGINVRDRYLASLKQEVYEIDGVYSTNTGTLNIPIMLPNSGSNIYEYNYVKIEFEKITRFCFIDDIQFRNYVAIIYYSEDIWHSYSAEMTFRIGLLTNAYHFAYGRNGKTLLKQLYLPTEYSVRDEYVLPEKFTEFVILAQIQLYQLSAETTSKRETHAVILGSAKFVNPENPDAWYYHSFDETETNIKIWATNAGIQKITRNNETWYYEIDNFTVLPYSYFSRNGMESFVDVSKNVFIFSSTETTDRPEKLAYELKHGCIEITDFIAGSNYKRIGVGTMTATYETVENNTSYHYSLLLYSDSVDIKILLNLQGKIIDITDNFIYEVPFSAITGDVTAQRKMARSMETVNGIRQIVGGVTKIGTSITSSVLTAGASEATVVAGKATANRLINSYNYTRRSPEYKSAMAKVVNAETRASQAGVEATGGVMGGVDSIIGGIQGIVQVNAPVYMSQKGTFVQGNKGISCQYGIFEKIPIVENETEINALVKEIGFQTNQIVSNDIFHPWEFTGSHNVLKFGSVNIFGNFPQSVCERLKSILLNGVKIWYDENSI